VNHIDTSDFYGPHVTNQLIREALHPYRDDLTIVTKIGARRNDKGAWLPAFSAQELTQAVHDNLRNLQLDVLDVVNLRIMFSAHGPAEGSIAEPLSTLAELQQQGGASYWPEQRHGHPGCGSAEDGAGGVRAEHVQHCEPG
jgi:aryl-alcohol dehydrogenase-like predicted oxidoreductase